jgi:citrate synthase
MASKKSTHVESELCEVQPQYRPGMEGQVAARSAISFIDGNKGMLEYRGININDLIDNSTYEETVFLLLYGNLPNIREFKRGKTLMSKQRNIPKSVMNAICNFPVGLDPMQALQSAIPLLQGEDFYADDVDFRKHNLLRATSLIAKVPPIVAAFDRYRNDEEPMPPVAKYSHAENFLFMLHGVPAKKKMARLLDKFLIAHAEHTINASTFTNRVIGSTTSSIYSSISGAVGALYGPLHGRANQNTLLMLEEIGDPENVEQYLEEALAAGTKIPGLGHRVYKAKDPRAVLLEKEIAAIIQKQGGKKDKVLFKTARTLEKAALTKLGKKGVYPNVDFYSGILLKMLKVPSSLFTPLFAISRVAGWSAHWIEQVSQNRIYRPIQQYIGDHGREYIPIEQR